MRLCGASTTPASTQRDSWSTSLLTATYQQTLARSQRPHPLLRVRCHRNRRRDQLLVRRARVVPRVRRLKTDHRICGSDNFGRRVLGYVGSLACPALTSAAFTRASCSQTTTRRVRSPRGPQHAVTLRPVNDVFVHHAWSAASSMEAPFAKSFFARSQVSPVTGFFRSRRAAARARLLALARAGPRGVSG